MANVPGALWLASHAGSAEVVLRGNSIVSVLNAAIIGMGLAVLPCFLADAETSLRRLTPAVVGTREIWLRFHPGGGRRGRERTVIRVRPEERPAEAAAPRGKSDAYSLETRHDRR